MHSTNIRAGYIRAKTQTQNQPKEFKPRLHISNKSAHASVMCKLYSEKGSGNCSFASEERRQFPEGINHQDMLHRVLIGKEGRCRDDEK